MRLNGEALVENSVTPSTVREGSTLEVAEGDLLLNDLNPMVVAITDGTGVLYYTTHLALRLFASDVAATSRGITVTREYFLADHPETPVTTAKVGDVLNVRVTFTLTNDVYYFVLENPLPAGTEGIDTNFLTTSRFVEGERFSRADDEDYWYWGWWWIDRTEIRDEQVNLYADYLPQGSYVYSYQVRAITPGEFQTLPSHRYAFYFPEVFGRSDGTLFSVLP